MMYDVPGKEGFQVIFGFGLDGAALAHHSWPRCTEIVRVVSLDTSIAWKSGKFKLDKYLNDALEELYGKWILTIVTVDEEKS